MDLKEQHIALVIELCLIGFVKHIHIHARDACQELNASTLPSLCSSVQDCEQHQHRREINVGGIQAGQDK